MKLPDIHTERIRLRMPAPSDLDAIYQLGSDPEVMRFISYGRTQTYSEARADLKRRIRQSADGFGYWIAEHKATRAAMGWMALKQLDNSDDVEIGYRFLQAFWNKGLATEGGRALLDFAFTYHNLERVVAVAMAANMASTRVMEKLGFKYDHRGIYYNTDCVFYILPREVWSKAIPLDQQK